MFVHVFPTFFKLCLYQRRLDKNQELGRTLHFERTHVQHNIYKEKKKEKPKWIRLKIYLAKHPISDIGIGPGQSQVPQGILMSTPESTFSGWGFRVFTIVELGKLEILVCVAHGMPHT